MTIQRKRLGKIKYQKSKGGKLKKNNTPALTTLNNIYIHVTDSDVRLKLN